MTNHRINLACESLENRQSRIESAMAKHTQEIAELLNRCNTARNDVIATQDLSPFSFFEQYKNIELKLLAMNTLLTFLKMNDDTFEALASED